MVQALALFAERPEVMDRVVFLEDYEGLLGEELVAGIDVWMNIPRRLLEASGTRDEGSGKRWPEPFRARWVVGGSLYAGSWLGDWRGMDSTPIHSEIPRKLNNFIRIWKTGLFPNSMTVMKMEFRENGLIGFVPVCRP